MNLKTKFARVGAVATTLALASLGMAGVATAADSGYVAPDADEQASLTIHKHVGNDELGDYTGEEPTNLGDPVEGVTFTIQQVGTMVEGDCVAPNLGTPAGWEAINAATVDNVCDLGTSEEVVTGEDGSVKVDLAQGLYKVTETDPGANLVTEKAIPFLVTLPMPLNNGWDYDVHVYPKNKLGDAEVTKTALDPDKVVPGATVPWTITANIPAVALPYTSIVVKDNPDAALADTTEIVSVAVEGYSALEEGTHYTLSADKLTVTLTEAGLEVVNAIVTGENAEAATLKVGVESIIPEDATSGKFTNSAEVLLNNKPYTPGGNPETIWGQLELNKVEKGTTNPLDRAEFAVFEGTCDIPEGTAPVAEGTTDADGKFTQTLYIGKRDADDTNTVEKTYCLKETAAPAGYILDEKGVEFTLTSEDNAITKTVDFENVKVTAPELPLTGAGGTMLLTGIGVALFVTGLGIVVAVRRRNA